MILKYFTYSILFTKILLADLSTGDRFPKLALVNQFGNTVSVPSKGKYTILFSNEKKVSIKVQDILLSKPKDFLKKHKIIYISDVSKAPSFFFRMFALPKLKNLPFAVALIYADDGQHLPSKTKMLSVLTIKDGLILKIKYLNANTKTY